MTQASIRRADEIQPVQQDWGSLTWYASEAQGNGLRMTLGKCVIKPGCENPKHHHPNCDEILIVQQGTVAHLIENGEEVTLNVGDVLTAPQGLVHQARNIGDVDAVLLIAFSAGDRKTVGE